MYRSPQHPVTRSLLWKQRAGVLWVFIFLFVGLTGCSEEVLLPEEANAIYAPELPPGVPPMLDPGDVALTKKRVELGRKLFYDPILSKTGDISCGSCHFQEMAFTDGEQLSRGIEGRLGFRNATSLVNLGWHETFNKDGGTRTIELQMIVPLTDSTEMGLEIRESVARLNEDPEYRRKFYEAFGESKISNFGMTRAIGAFLRTLISANSPYDDYNLRGNRNALTNAQKRGLELFRSDELKCSSCHSDWNLRKAGFENNGLYVHYADSGRARITLDPNDAGKFKVPSLRNITLTAPYMHDGSLRDLDAVIDHYAAGGVGHRNQSPLVAGFSISPEERADLKAFLESLTDPEFLSNPDFAPPP